MRALVAVLIISGSAPAYSQESHTSEFWLSRCKTQIPECNWYIGGFLRGYENGYLQSGITHGAKDALRAPFCIPENASYNQLRLMAMKYAADRPQQLHWLFTYAIAQAIREGFPCLKDTGVEQTGKR